MTAESDALADALVEPRYCTACGHDERVPLMNGQKCCPHERYRTVSQILDEREQFEKTSRSAHNEVINLRKMIDRLRFEMEMEKNPPKTPTEPVWVRPEPYKKKDFKW